MPDSEPRLTLPLSNCASPETRIPFSEEFEIPASSAEDCTLKMEESPPFTKISSEY